MFPHRVRARTILVAAAAVGVAAGISVAIAQQGGGSTTPNADLSIPNQPRDVAEFQQTAPAAKPDAATPRATAVPGAGRLARLSSSIDVRSWTLAASPDFPIAAAMPPGYFASFRVFNILDGTRGYELRITNFDLKADEAKAAPEGAPTMADRVGITVQVYPSGPGSIGESDTPVSDETEIELPGLGHAVMTVKQRFVRPQLGSAHEEVQVAAQAPVSGGRYVVVTGQTTSPGNDDLVAQFIAVLKSIEVK